MNKKIFIGSRGGTYVNNNGNKQYISKICDFIKPYLHSKENDIALFDICLNICLVVFKGREVTLVEHSNINYDQIKIQEIKQFIESLNHLGANIQIQNWGIRHFFVFKNNFNISALWMFFSRYGMSIGDKRVGKLLKFKCAGQQGWDDNEKNRLELCVFENKTKIDVYVEVCVSQKMDINLLSDHGKKLCLNFNRAMKQCDYSFSFKITEIIGTLELLGNMKIDNINFMRNHADRYYDEFYNIWNTKESLSAKKFEKSIKSIEEWQNNKKFLILIFEKFVLTNNLSNKIFVSNNNSRDNTNFKLSKLESHIANTLNVNDSIKKYFP